MSQRIVKPLIIILICLSAVLLTAATNYKWRSLQFSNPGTKRMLKTSGGNYYYYRSLPEKNMLLDVRNIKLLEVRALSKSKVDKPQFILKYGNKKQTFDLKITSVSVQYYIFEPIRINLPTGVTQVELTCYNRNIYFRVFEGIPIVPKKPLPALKINRYFSTYTLTTGTKSTLYYGFNKTRNFSFRVLKGKPFTLYVRAELINKQAPAFDIYADDQLVTRVELSAKETATYKAKGITHLTIGKKIVFPARDKMVNYTLQPVSDHLFIAKPVVNKVKQVQP